MEVNWIRPDVRLPELIEYYSKDVLVSNGREMNICYLVDINYDSKDPHLVWVIVGRDGYRFDNVIAWTELPKVPSIHCELCKDFI